MKHDKLYALKISTDGVLSVLPWPEEEDRELRFLQDEVGGLFLQHIRYLCLEGTKNMQLLENAEGKLDRLPLNSIATGLMVPEQRRAVYGNTLLVKKAGAVDTGMTMEEASRIIDRINMAVIETA